MSAASAGGAYIDASNEISIAPFRNILSQ